MQLYAEPDPLIKVVRDLFNDDFTRLVVEGDDAWDTLQTTSDTSRPSWPTRLHRHVGTQDVFAAYRIDEQMPRRWTARCTCRPAARW